VTEKEVRDAILTAQKPAEQGDVRSQHFLGISYLGLKDFGMAAKWFEKAAEQGFADAQMRLGLQYSTGQGVPKDEAKGLEWLGKAAAQGHARAQFHMGNLTEDKVKSAEWYEKAAEQGDVDAQYELGLLYYNGEGVPKDEIKAGQWFNKAGEQGHEKAKELVGKIFANALFDNPEIQKIRIEAAHKAYMEGNHAKAAELYGEMADRGNAMAQYKLSLLYRLGQGVQSDFTKADVLIRKAAEQGLEEAKDFLNKQEREAEERKRKEEERERKEREHKEWLASEEGQRWQTKEKAAAKRNKIGRVIAPLLMLLSITLTFIGFEGLSGTAIFMVILMLIPFLFLYFSKNIILRIIFLIGSIALTVWLISLAFGPKAEEEASAVKEIIIFIVLCASYLLSCISSMIFPKKS